ncbi:MAG: hypothetical protein D6741_09710 [Planctomycetota bacterium]|nr:MAG: hypothetical protein D6741_09710 [Planctomycetota bacterium]
MPRRRTAPVVSVLLDVPSQTVVCGLKKSESPANRAIGGRNPLGKPVAARMVYETAKFSQFGASIQLVGESAL